MNSKLTWDIDRREMLRELEQIESHVCHPFFRTRQAIDMRSPDSEIYDAIEADRAWVGDIFNEADHMVSQLISKHKSSDRKFDNPPPSCVNT